VGCAASRRSEVPLSANSCGAAGFTRPAVITSPTRATGPSTPTKVRQGTCEKLPIIMFCGLPGSSQWNQHSMPSPPPEDRAEAGAPFVASAPAPTAQARGQIASLTRKAENRPEVARDGAQQHSRALRVIQHPGRGHRKETERRRLATTIIVPRSNVMVSRSIAR